MPSLTCFWQAPRRYLHRVAGPARRALRFAVLLSFGLLLAQAPLCVLAQPVPAQLDAAGDGSLRPPTSPRYANPAWYDIIEVRLLEGSPSRIAVELGAVDGSGALPHGVTQPIIEVYVDIEEGGAEELLPGSGLSMPLGDGWQLAFRVTGDGAWAWQAEPDGSFDLAAPVPIEVVVQGRVLTLLTPFERPESAPRLYAISGVYDPFRADGWRPLSREQSAWAFSSATQVVPVVDVFPSDPATRAEALARGELPRAPSATGLDVASLAWIALMLAGVAIAVVGVVLRARAPRAAPAPAQPASMPTQVLAADPVADPAADPVADPAADAAVDPELIEEADLGPDADQPEADQPEADQPEADQPDADQPEEDLLVTADVPDADAGSGSEDEDAVDSEVETEDEETGSSETEAPSDDRREAKRS